MSQGARIESALGALQPQANGLIRLTNQLIGLWRRGARAQGGCTPRAAPSPESSGRPPHGECLRRPSPASRIGPRSAARARSGSSRSGCDSSPAAASRRRTHICAT
eukprot:scaffold1552_cov144-Isochrysis_galbana.AAC.6